MAHDKVFGVCENKCFVEVAPKNMIYTKDDFIIAQNLVYNVPAKEAVMSPVILQDLGLTAPEQVAVVSIMQHVFDDNEAANYELTPHLVINAESGSGVSGKVYPYVNMTHGGVQVGVYNPTNTVKTIGYLLVLLKL